MNSWKMRPFQTFSISRSYTSISNINTTLICIVILLSAIRKKDY